MFLTPVLCNKRCVRKLQFVVRTWIDLNKNTIHLMALAISRFTEYRLFALFWLLPGRPRCAGYWRAVLGHQNLPVLGTYGHLCDKLPVWIKKASPRQDKLSLCYGLLWQMDGSKVTFSGVTALKLMISDVPIEPHKGLYACAIKSTTFCFEIGIHLIWFVKHGGKI